MKPLNKEKCKQNFMLMTKHGIAETERLTVYKYMLGGMFCKSDEVKPDIHILRG